jgi:hypothetical protein
MEWSSDMSRTSDSLNICGKDQFAIRVSGWTLSTEWGIFDTVFRKLDLFASSGVTETVLN